MPPSNPTWSSFMAISSDFSCAQGCLEFPSLPCSLRCDYVTTFLSMRCKQKYCMAASGNFLQKTDGTCPLPFFILCPACFMEDRCNGCQSSLARGPWGHTEGMESSEWPWVPEDTVEQLWSFYFRTLVWKKNKRILLKLFILYFCFSQPIWIHIDPICFVLYFSILPNKKSVGYPY